MPARKSCWSRIMGEREVRPIWSSTSASIEASVPSTISTSTGSTSVTTPASRRTTRAPSRDVDPPPPRAGPAGSSRTPRPPRAGHLVARAQVGAPHHRRVVPAPAKNTGRVPVGATVPVPAGRAGASGGASSGPTPVRRTFTHSTPCPGPVPVAVAVQPLVLVVEAGQDRAGQVGVDRTGRDVDPHLERLAVVAQVGRAQEPLVGGVEPLGAEGGGRLGPPARRTPGQGAEVEVGGRPRRCGRRRCGRPR